jgi:predicted acylesterase/phospholipase RssA
MVASFGIARRRPQPHVGQMRDVSPVFRVAAWLLSAAVILLAPRAAAAQHSLVLSGGGARGLSHAGSLLALEELGYQPHLVVGTSMGAIVGALYAAGYPAADIRRIIADENWLERFSAVPILIGAERSPRRPLLSFGLNGARFYEGLLPTTGVNRRLVELLFDAGAVARNDFDRLPRRYRAVAADLATGHQVVLDSGDLPRAVRASMAVPGAFAPIAWGDTVLIDGGVANNLPVSVADSISDAPILAIDVLRPEQPVAERSALDLGVRALRLLIENARPASTPDILVTPKIGPGFSETRFPADASFLLNRGYSAVIAQVDSARPREPAPAPVVHPAPPHITAIVPHASAPDARLIARFMQSAAGAYDATEIVRRVSALYGTGLFEAVWPVLRFNDASDSAELHIDVTPVARTSLALAARWDADVGAALWTSLRQRIAIVTPWELRAALELNELKTAGSVDVSAFSSRLPGLLWNAGVHAGRTSHRSYDDDRVIGTADISRAGGWAGAELHPPARDIFISLLARADRVNAPGTDSDGAAFGVFARAAAPAQPDRIAGAEPLLELDVRTGDLSYARMQARFGTTAAAGRARYAWFSDIVHATAAAPLDALPAAEYDLAPWLRTGALRAHTRMTIAADAAHPFLFDSYLRLRMRAIGTDAAANLDTRGSWHAGAEAGVIWPTIVGPVSVGFAWGSGGLTRVNASIGARF